MTERSPDTAVDEDFWVYENWTVHTATVHHGWCRSCNHGAGQFVGGKTRHGGWHGRYATEAEANSAPIRANSMLRNCGTCME
jgi:hypothetical protein